MAPRHVDLDRAIASAIARVDNAVLNNAHHAAGAYGTALLALIEARRDRQAETDKSEHPGA